jgi:uroporphyrinogen decarboxylase
MQPRERVLAAINHQKTDRAPCDYWAHAGVTEALIGRLGVADYEELLQALHVDLRRVNFSYSFPDSGPDEQGYVTNMWGVKTLPNAAVAYSGRVDEQASEGALPRVLYPFTEASTVDDVYAHPWPRAELLDYAGILPQAVRYHDTYATYGAPWSPFFHEVGWIIGQETYFLWMYTRPEMVDAVVDCVVSFELECTRRYFEAAQGKVDIAFFGNDFGTQRGLVVSPRMFARFFRQPLKRYFDIAHDFGARVMKHSCGGVRAIIPWWIEDGVNVLDPVQVLAEGMEFAGLVRDFGAQMCFHGGIDTQQLLPFRPQEDVRAQVRHFRDLTRAQGGYILLGSQEYIEDVPLDNILAIYDENAGMT